MIAQIFTLDQILNCEGRNYNPSVWDKKVNDMAKYKDVVFYQVAKGNGYDYDRYFVEYTLPEGLRLFGSFGYGGGLSSGGFYALDKMSVTEDGKSTIDIVTMAESGDVNGAMELASRLKDSKFIELKYRKFYNEQAKKMTLIGTSKEARKWMTERSEKHGMTFTKG